MPGLVGEVLDVGDLGEHVLLDELGDLRMTPSSPPFLTPYGSSVTTIARLAAAQLLDVGAGAHDDAAAAGAVRLADPVAADDDRAGREVGALEVLRQVVDVRSSGSSISATTASIASPRWCGGMFVAMPTAMPGRAVDEQVREPRRQHERLLARPVVVRPEVDGVRVDVAQHLGRESP